MLCRSSPRAGGDVHNEDAVTTCPQLYHLYIFLKYTDSAAYKTASVQFFWAFILCVLNVVIKRPIILCPVHTELGISSSWIGYAVYCTFTLVVYEAIQEACHALKGEEVVNRNWYFI